MFAVSFYSPVDKIPEKLSMKVSIMKQRRKKTERRTRVEGRGNEGGAESACVRSVNRPMLRDLSNTAHTHTHTAALASCVRSEEFLQRCTVHPFSAYFI